MYTDTYRERETEGAVFLAYFTIGIVGISQTIVRSRATHSRVAVKPS